MSQLASHTTVRIVLCVAGHPPIIREIEVSSPILPEFSNEFTEVATEFSNEGWFVFDDASSAYAGRMAANAMNPNRPEGT